MLNCSDKDSLCTTILSHIDQTPVLIPASITAVIAVFGIMLTVISLRSSYKLARTKNSLDFEKAIEDSTRYSKSHIEIASFKNQTNLDVSALKAIANDPKLDYEAYKAATNILNWWERGANGIKCKAYREDVLFKVYCSEVLNISNYLMPFIEQRRDTRNNPYIFKEFIWLNKRWSRKRSRQKTFKPSKILTVFIIATLTFTFLYITNT
ncbi:DUF4760 domain-containing protein [Colwellia sp. Arc7-635]|uniref:DUF4760 domain-containing protein n=1 Tax=Colwellia sp. Arc7-635 TaxID=2497879 RepID=UPI000F8510C4|nr:DUF4760 domain-containing protein [Colwellia sp. Arc7-635]AZQ85890.1 DUF4760 domain-containing protein [Colwellia sp. Arc7-635]